MADKASNMQERPSTPVSARFAAGEDPAKREQILDGARRVFMRVGFDAASMNDVTREAGVSKGTIYVYFSNKEDLFAALIERQKSRFVDSLRHTLKDQPSVESGLRSFAQAFIHQVVATDMVPAMRSVLGVYERMPGLCHRFLNAAPTNARTVLVDFLELHAAKGHLSIDDSRMAAQHFIDLSTASYFKLRLFNELTTPPPQSEIDYTIDCALKVFMKAYGPTNS